MITVVMVVILGVHVFPDYGGWWIAYGVFAGVVTLIKWVVNTVKIFKEHNLL